MGDVFVASVARGRQCDVIYGRALHTFIISSHPFSIYMGIRWKPMGSTRVPYGIMGPILVQYGQTARMGRERFLT